VTEEQRFMFTATDPVCGHVVAAAVDGPNHRKDVAQDVGQWVLDGLRVERVSCQLQPLAWCSEECPRMQQVRAEQAAAEARERKAVRK
jgi:hypothetical protein